MSDTVLVALVASVPVIAGGLAAWVKWTLGLYDRAAKAEALNAVYAEMMPEATETLKRSADAMRRHAKPQPFASIARRGRPVSPRSGRRP